MREFRRANVVKINPSMAQMELRGLTLKQGKKLLVPSPGHSHPSVKTLTAVDPAFFYLLDPSSFSKKSQIYKAATKRGSAELGTPLNEDWSQIDRIDLGKSRYG